MIDDNIVTQKMIELAELIGYEPTDISFLKKAMYCQIIHEDGDGKNRKNYTNDSFATLGDAILKLILTEFLFDKGYDKAEITKRKKDIEKNDTLFNLCNKSGIFNYAYNDKYFSPNAPKQNKVPHSKHDVYIEAIIAAIYKDKGFDYCKKWVTSFFDKYDILFL